MRILAILGLLITVHLHSIRFDGKALDPPYTAPVFTGAEPTPPGFENGKVYQGSCHCGAVTLAVKVNGSMEDGTYKELILTCNCSFCRQVS